MKLSDAYQRAFFHADKSDTDTTVILHTNGGQLRAVSAQRTLSGMLEVMLDDGRFMMFSDNGTPVRMAADTSSINYVRSVEIEPGIVAEVK